MAATDDRGPLEEPTDAYLRAAARALMPLDRAQLEALSRHVDAALAAGGCDRTRRVTDAWADQHGVALGRLHEGLEEYGGFCDCEVVMNVDPDVVFEPVGLPGS